MRRFGEFNYERTWIKRGNGKVGRKFVKTSKKKFATSFKK
jgi:hypothetical protein